MARGLDAFVLRRYASPARAGGDNRAEPKKEREATELRRRRGGGRVVEAPGAKSGEERARRERVGAGGCEANARRTERSRGSCGQR